MIAHSLPAPFGPFLANFPNEDDNYIPPQAYNRHRPSSATCNPNPSSYQTYNGFGANLNQFRGYNSNCFGDVRMKEEEEMQHVRKNGKEAAIIEVEAEEGNSEVQKLSEEMMAYESYMKFYQIPYLDGQSQAALPILAQ